LERTNKLVKGAVWKVGLDEEVYGGGDYWHITHWTSIPELPSDAEIDKIMNGNEVNDE